VTGSEAPQLEVKDSSFVDNQLGLYIDRTGLQGSAFTLTHSTLSDNDVGISLIIGSAADIAIHDNNLTNRTANVQVRGVTSDPLDLSGNWWGTGDPDAVNARIQDCTQDASRPCTKVQPVLRAPVVDAGVPMPTPDPAATPTPVPIPAITGASARVLHRKGDQLVATSRLHLRELALFTLAFEAVHIDEHAVTGTLVLKQRGKAVAKYSLALWDLQGDDVLGKKVRFTSRARLGTVRATFTLRAGSIALTRGRTIKVKP
jgi:hypothetical protein